MLDPDCRDDELNQALEALHFAFRAVTARPDALLARHGLSRVHHRILYFVGRNPGLCVQELLSILQTSKQALSAPLRLLVEAGLIRAASAPDDRRLRRLHLTARGARLEDKLSQDQRQRFARVFAKVGRKKTAAWHEVMRRLAKDDGAG
jgi:DNA-binding MarR family transcriptional regulator